MPQNSLHHCPFVPYANRIEGSMNRSQETHVAINEIKTQVPAIVTAINRANLSNTIMMIILAVLLVLKEVKGSNTDFKASGFGTSFEATHK
jgi:hypothetical protein